MTEKKIVTLRSAPSVSVEVPDSQDSKTLQRSCFGAIRLFPGIPKTVTKDELEFIEKTDPDLYGRLVVQPYVESKRIDRRGVAESEVDRLAAEEGIAHLSHGKQVEVLRSRGKISKAASRKVELVEEKPTAKRHKAFGDK